MFTVPGTRRLRQCLDQRAGAKRYLAQIDSVKRPKFFHCFRFDPSSVHACMGIIEKCIRGADLHVCLTAKCEDVEALSIASQKEKIAGSFQSCSPPKFTQLEMQPRYPHIIFKEQRMRR